MALTLTKADLDCYRGLFESAMLLPPWNVVKQDHNAHVYAWRIHMIAEHTRGIPLFKDALINENMV